MDPQPYNESSRYSVELDRRFWADNPDFFFNSLHPRLSKYAVRACIQAQIDVFGKDHVGIVQGSLAPSGNFAAVVYPESLPDRLPIVAYLNELLSFYEAFEEEMAELMGSTLDGRVPKDLKFNNPTWQANFKVVLPKLVKTLCEADPVLGGKTMKSLKEMAEAPDLGPRMDSYEKMDDYINDRFCDIAWQSVMCCAEFGAKLTLTPEQIASIEQVFWPLWAYSACVYDHYTWEKELRDAEKHKSDRNTHAKTWLKNRCLDFEKESLCRKDTFSKEHAEAELAPDLRRCFDYQEAIATGFALWCSTTFRHHPPYGDSYRAYYGKRISEGALRFNESTESESLLTGGDEVRYETGKRTAT